MPLGYGDVASVCRSLIKDFRVFSIFRAINFKKQLYLYLFFFRYISQVWFAIMILEVSPELISSKATAFENDYL